MTTLFDMKRSATSNDVMKPAKVVTVADAADVDRAIATLVLAFGADPVARWMYDDPNHYLRHILRLFRAPRNKLLCGRSSSAHQRRPWRRALASAGRSQRR